MAVCSSGAQCPCVTCAVPPGVTPQFVHFLASPPWESTQHSPLTPPAYLPANVASRDLSSVQLDSGTALSPSQTTPCACPRATMVWVARDPPHCVAPVLTRGFGFLTPQQEPNCLFSRMLFLPPTCPKHQPPSPLCHHPTFLLEMSFSSYLALMSAQILSKAMFPSSHPAHNEPWLPGTETRK